MRAVNGGENTDVMKNIVYKQNKNKNKCFNDDGTRLKNFVNISQFIMLNMSI